MEVGNLLWGIDFGGGLECLGLNLCDLLERPERWDAMGQAARRLAQTRLSWPVLAGEVERFLRRFVPGE